MKKIVSLLFLFLSAGFYAQQLNCTVQVNAQKAPNLNNQTVINLENSIKEFINKTDWIGNTVEQNEKINCSLVITINGYNSNQFAATIQVQSTRPIYNTTYHSPVFNFNDNDFNFEYIDYQNLNYNPLSYESNLVSVLSFYSFMILGIDADTFSMDGGDKYFEVAQQIASVAQQSGGKGWNQSDGNQNRYFLINDMQSNTYESYRKAMYKFHREGLDVMSDDVKEAKNQIIESINILSEIYSVRPSAFLTRVFFDAKSDEIVSIFSGGQPISLSSTIELLNKISPTNSGKWSSIKL